MENEPLNNQAEQPTDQAQQQAPKKSHLKMILWAAVILVVGTVGYFVAKEGGISPTVFKAALTEVGNPTNEASFAIYIPDNYHAVAGDPVTLEIRAGGTTDFNFTTFDAKFSFNSAQISFTDDAFINNSTGLLSGASLVIDNVNGNELIATLVGVDVTLVSGVNDGDLLFTISGTLAGGLSAGDTVDITPTGLTLVGASGVDETNFGTGTITIDLPACGTNDWNCSGFTEGVCDANNEEVQTCTLKATSVGNCDDGAGTQGRPALTRPCTCDQDDWSSSCTAFGACVDGEQLRTCDLPVTCVVRASTPTSPAVSQECGLLTGDVSGLILSLDEPTVNSMNLNPTQKAEAFAAAVVMVNNSVAAGTVLDIEGTPLTLTFTGLGTDLESEKLENIAQNLADDINTAGIGLTATPNTRMPSGTIDLPGFVLINTTATNNDDDVDIAQTFQAGNVSILPFPVNGLTLLQTDNFGMQIVARFADNTTKLLVAREVVWVNDINNRLSDVDLDSGRLKAGDASGFSTVYATVIVEDPGTGVQTTIFSNTITVNVPSGPVIEEAVRIGVSPIVQGGRVNLRVTVSDFDTIQDIAQIFVDLVDANDPTRIFDSTAVVSEVVIEAEGDGDEVDTQGNIEKFRTYNIPIDIIQNSLMFDGPYNLEISIRDAAGFIAEAVVPITIGAIATGDIDGIGGVNMIDVILLFQIVNGTLTPTPEQQAAANVDGLGGVNMIDVITLYNLVNQ